MLASTGSITALSLMRYVTLYFGSCYVCRILSLFLTKVLGMDVVLPFGIRFYKGACLIGFLILDI